SWVVASWRLPPPPSPGRPETDSGRRGPLRRLRDVIEHPDALARGHRRLAVGADARLVDRHRRPAVRALRDLGSLADLTSCRLAADEGPELGKRLDRLIPTHHFARVIDLVIFGDGIEADGDAIKVRVARHLRHSAAIDGEVFEHVALVHGDELLDLQLPALVNPIGEIDTSRLQVACHPGVLQHEERHLSAVDEHLLVEVRIAGLQRRKTPLTGRGIHAGPGRQRGLGALPAATGLPPRQPAVDEERADQAYDDEEDQRRPAARAARAATAAEKDAPAPAATVATATAAAPTPTAASAPGAGQRGELDGDRERPRCHECDEN